MDPDRRHDLTEYQKEWARHLNLLPKPMTTRAKDIELTLTEVKILRETAKRLRWIGAVVTADVMQGIVDRWEEV